MLMSQELTGRGARIRDVLRAEFSPSELEIRDESKFHAGHAGASPEGETHYAIRIRAAALSTMKRIDRHRAINAVLANEFSAGLHALSIDAA